MKFHEQYRKALELLPADCRRFFQEELFGMLAHCAGSRRAEQCLAVALDAAQKFEEPKVLRPYLLKGGKRAAL